MKIGKLRLKNMILLRYYIMEILYIYMFFSLTLNLYSNLKEVQFLSMNMHQHLTIITGSFGNTSTLVCYKNKISMKNSRLIVYKLHFSLKFCNLRKLQ